VSRSRRPTPTRSWTEGEAAGLDGSDKIVVSTKMLRAGLLSVKADLERELAKVALDCTV
jgi:sirohydrochlorin ferrochelatase